MPKPLLPALQEMARLLGGEVVKGNVLCPGPGHSADDRSLSVTPSPKADCGFVVNSFAGDDVNVCKDYVRQKLDLPPFEPKPKKRNGKGDGKLYSPTIAKYIYRTADGQPYLCVHRLADKKQGFPQYHWDGQLWKAGVPKGPKIPYRLPELIAATTPVYIVEGEGKCDLLAKLGFTVTSASEGAGKWTADLNEWFKDRVVYVLPDNDEPGRKHAQLVARNLDPVAKCVRIVELPDLPHKGDVKQWLEHDPSGARLIKECARAPIWEPAAVQPRSKEVDEALVSELAALSKLDYAKRRKGAAEEIGITVGELDKIVVEVRGEAKPDEDQEWAVDPWPDEVATADLLATLCETYRQHVILPEHGAEAMALWALHAWTMDASTISPFLFFTSPMMRCGKSTALMLLKRTAPRPALASNISPAAIFRYIERCRPTLIIDEADGFVTGNEELRCILNSGHARDTAHVIRCDGEANEPRRFSTWAPKIVAAIGKLAATLVDRSIVISMRRRKPSESVAKLRARDTGAFETLRRKAARWSTDNIERLREARPSIPEALNDRASDNWEPLLAIADLAGYEWVQAARAAAMALSADAEMGTETTKTLLLSDIKDIFAASALDAMPSKNLVAALHDDQTKPWLAYGKNQKPISDRQVSDLLKEFKVYPRNIKTGGKVLKGYVLSSFAEAFESYLSPLGGPPAVTALLSSNDNGLAGVSAATARTEVAAQSPRNPLETNNSSVVAARDTLKDETKVKKVAGHSCDYCHEPPDGTEQQAAYGTEALWLHPHCIDRFLEAKDDGLDIPECLRRY
jgi:putative DNA primase/helicase